MFTNPFRRGRGVARWPKLARVIDKGGGQDGAHALGVGAQGQGDAKGDDNGVLALGCRGHSSSMSPGPVLVEARDLADIVGQRLVVGPFRRRAARRPRQAPARGYPLIPAEPGRVRGFKKGVLLQDVLRL